ncbi:MAG: Archaeosine synthase [Methanomassiliicoccales archaeon PtaB.Bin215]|nr:MAG: Archaeosine synthase [Methanomassiliicoccales archaeon PtaB.Bin215]
MLELLARSGTARRCLWSLEGAKAETPGAFVVEGGAEGLALMLAADSSALLMDGRTVLETKGNGLIIPLKARSGMKDSCLPPAAEGQDIAVLDGAFELRRDARAFVKAMVELRASVGRSKLIYAPGIAEPSNLAVLAYLGVDLFDTSLVDHRAAIGQLALVEGSMDAAKAGWVPEGSDLRKLNRDTILKELALVRSMISSGRMREFAELRCHSTPWNVAALRIFDDEHYEHQEIDFPVIGPRFYCNAKQSLVRPDVKRFREMVRSRFHRPEHRKILLLIPCSAKKPYYTSKSHQLFRQVLWEVPNSQVVQEMIVTSPLGTVPRELELFYPAAQYDIPVTGHWDREEEAMVQDMVLSMASQGYEHVVLHLGDEGPIIQEVLDGTITSNGSPTSNESLGMLKETLRELCSKYDRVDPSLDRWAAMSSVAGYQFGPGGEALLEEAHILGNYPFMKIMRRKEQLGMLNPERGMISLTVEGAEAILPLIPKVTMGDFELKGSLFAVGVMDADPSIRAGEEVAIMRNGKIAGVGVAVMGGREME